MHTNQLRTAGLVVAALVVFTTGIWLTRSGKPYGSALMNIHKLVDLAAVVTVGVMVFQGNRAASFSAVEWAIVGSAVVLVIAALASGGVVSAMEAPPNWVLWLHRIAPFVMGALVAGVAYLSMGRG